MEKKVLLQIGPYSAVGGVSVHIKRLSELLKDFYYFKFIDESPLHGSNDQVFNMRSRNMFQYFKLIRAADIIHIHSGLSWLRCFHIFSAFLFRKRIIVSIHSLSNLRSGFSIIITRLFLRLTNKTITVSDEVAKRIRPKKEYIIPAFVPPIMEKEPELPKTIVELLARNKGKKIIISNAFKLVFYQNEDLYGLDLIINVARKIKEQKKEYKIIFIVTSANEKLTLYDEIIKKEKLKEIISLVSHSVSFVKLILKSDLVIRATNTDGDALTVREALYLKCPIIASDAVKRPKGVILFKNRNSEDLFSRVNEILEKEKVRRADYSAFNNQKNYQDCYNSILQS